MRPGDLVPADDPATAIQARVIAIRRSGAARRAELMLAEGLPSVEIELPAGHCASKGDVLPVSLATIRLFTSR